MNETLSVTYGDPSPAQPNPTQPRPTQPSLAQSPLGKYLESEFFFPSGVQRRTPLGKYLHLDESFHVHLEPVQVV